MAVSRYAESEGHERDVSRRRDARFHPSQRGAWVRRGRGAPAGADPWYRRDVSSRSTGASCDPTDIAGFDALGVLGPRVTAATLAGNERLTLVARFGVGYDNIDVPACTAHGVFLYHHPGGGAAADGRRQSDLHPGPCRTPARTGPADPRGSLGRQAGCARHRAGRQDPRHHRVRPNRARRPIASPDRSGCATSRMTRTRLPAVAEAEGVELTDLETLLQESDFVVVAAALTPETRHIINAERLAMMKPTAHLISTARGPLVDQVALYEALRDRRIAGAGMDVFEQEPVDPNDPILKLENVIVTPHALCWTDECERIMGESVLRSIQEVAAGKVPTNVVNREAADTPEMQAKLTHNIASGWSSDEGEQGQAGARGGRAVPGDHDLRVPDDWHRLVLRRRRAPSSLIYDMEHTGWSIETIRGLMATSRAADLVPMVRIPATQYHLIARPLDVGAMGLMVPMVESAEQARSIVDSAKYPPVGRRGAAFGVAHDDYTGRRHHRENGIRQRRGAAHRADRDGTGRRERRCDRGGGRYRRPLDRALRSDELPRYSRTVLPPDLPGGRRAGVGGLPAAREGARDHGRRRGRRPGALAAGIPGDGLFRRSLDLSAGAAAGTRRSARDALGQIGPLGPTGTPTTRGRGGMSFDPHCSGRELKGDVDGRNAEVRPEVDAGQGSGESE